MRYSHSLKKYHRESHFIFSTAVLMLLVGAVFALILLSHTNTLSFLSGITVSTFRVGFAYILALPISLALVLFITQNKILENIFVPILDVFQSFPSFAILMPLLVVFRHSSLSISLFLVTAMIWPLIFTVLSSFKTSREDLEEAAIVFGAKGLKKLFYFRLPYIFPALVTGSIIAWGEAWEAIVAAEIIAQIGGIGVFIGESYQTQNRQVFILSIIALMLFIFILNRLIWLPLLKKSTAYQTE